MKLLKLIPDKTKIPFTKYRWHALVLTTAAFFGAIVLFFTPGLNLGVDFRGGITIEVEDDAPIDLAKARGALTAAGVEGGKVQEFGAPNIVIVAASLVKPDTADQNAIDQAQQTAAGQIQTALKAALGDDIKIRRVEVVGGTVSKELIEKGFLAVILASLMMLIYIWIRFEWQWGLGAVIGVLHDSVITLGIFALLRFEFNLTSVAAILTVIGYSVNDTVVVYDRIRENLRKYKKMPLTELIDLSLNETLTRTVVTGGTTLLALGALIAFGGEVLRGFSVIIFLGIIIGTYSSLFVAAPFLLLTGVKREWTRGVTTASATP
jgi:preprotein translocase SecF subunit